MRGPSGWAGRQPNCPLPTTTLCNVAFSFSFVDPGVRIKGLSAATTVLCQQITLTRGCGRGRERGGHISTVRFELHKAALSAFLLTTTSKALMDINVCYIRYFLVGKEINV